MGFYPPKISIQEVKKYIVQAFDEALSKQADFSGDSLACFGFEIEFEAKVTLHARETQEIKITGQASGKSEELTDEKLVDKVVTVSGSKAHGRYKPRVAG